jgi:hypothetical protein
MQALCPVKSSLPVQVFTTSGYIHISWGASISSIVFPTPGYILASLLSAHN